MNRKIDDLGRIVIPKEMRKQLNINNGDEVNIEVIENKVVINKSNEVNYKQILDEVREYIEEESSHYSYEDDYDFYLCENQIQDLLQILDKAK